MALFIFYLVYSLIGWGIRVIMVTVVLRRQFAPGASVAWLGIVFLHPYIGLTLYMLVGESRLGPHRTQRRREITARFRDPARHAGRLPHQTQLEPEPPYQPLVLQAEKISDLPVLAGNQVDFLPDSAEFIRRLVADINAATQHVHLLYYIFACDQTASAVADALMQAVKRGVHCRLLADALASRMCFHRSGLGPKLIAAGVEVIPALPVAPFRRRLARMDLRNHRKLAIIDGRIAFVGSNNIINPDYGGRRGNPWIDLSARFTGPIVGELASIFAEDWAFETNQEIEIPYPDSANAPSPSGAADVLAQVVPTGPTEPDETYRRLLLAAIQSSRRELILTTPYFVPDETTLLSMMMAADRGVAVKLILPRTADHFFTAAAGRAHYLSLLKSGVQIHLYKPALLHAKTTTVDDAFALFGSANLDVRSFSLNFELSIMLYGKTITERLRAIQKEYLAQSVQLNLADWQNRPVVSEFTDRAVSLLSPLL